MSVFGMPWSISGLPETPFLPNAKGLQLAIPWYLVEDDVSGSPEMLPGIPKAGIPYKHLIKLRFLRAQRANKALPGAQKCWEPL